jgi:hypothetical protein
VLARRRGERRKRGRYPREAHVGDGRVSAAALPCVAVESRRRCETELSHAVLLSSRFTPSPAAVATDAVSCRCSRSRFALGFYPSSVSFPDRRSECFFPGRGRGTKAGIGQNFYSQWPNRTGFYGLDRFVYGLKFSGRKGCLPGPNWPSRTEPRAKSDA